MKYKRIIAGLLLAACVAAISAFKPADDDLINKIAAQLDNWLSFHPQEKVYLQMDKPYYAIGDDIWFKAYVTIGSNHALSALSGALNVELIDDKDSVKQRIKLPVVNGLSWGDFALADTLKEGNYRVRAYTNFMRNAGEDYFFDKTIFIANAISNNVFTKSTYTYSTENGRQKVNVLINYAALDGKPYAAAPVSYQVELGGKNAARGKAVTDDKGNINISFINPSQGALKSGHINTELKLTDKKVAEKTILVKAASANTDVQFFPEGGNLVNANESKIAFKAVGTDGLGADVKGVVIDDQGKQVSTFSSTHLGMGEFSFNPEAGRTYKAKITCADGSEVIANLPGATDAGYTLNVDNSDTSVVVVTISPGKTIMTSSSETEVISLIGQSGGVIYYGAKSKPGSKSFSAHIAKSKFPSGIAQFTLFNSAGEPLNERLVFIQNNDELKFNVSASKTYKPREKVKIGFDVFDKDKTPAVGSFSIAVTDETKVPVDENTETTIMSNLLLTSDLKGYIEQPGYYFNDANPKAGADLDILMLTQGYHRFEWKQVISNSYRPPVFLPEKTLEISGHVKTPGGKPVPDSKVTLLSTAGKAFILDTVTDNEGRFSFKNLYFKDSIKFVIQARTAKGRKNLDIDLDTVAPQRVGKNKNAPDLQVNISDVLSPFLENSRAFYMGQLKYGVGNHAILLKEVEIKEKKIKRPVENSANLNGPGNADQVLLGNDVSLLSCANLTDCLQGRLMGVIFRNGIPYSTRSIGRPMMVMIDGAQVDNNFLNDLNPATIGSIEVLRGITYTSIYGAQGSNGIILITTKSGVGDNFYQRYSPGIITYSPKGYYKAREFYSPRYDDPKTNAQVPDLRSTIYWKPNIITAADGKASVEYFNADNKGTYRVVIEGIDANGHPGREVYRYKVE